MAYALQKLFEINGIKVEYLNYDVFKKLQANASFRTCLKYLTTHSYEGIVRKMIRVGLIVFPLTRRSLLKKDNIFYDFRNNYLNMGAKNYNGRESELYSDHHDSDGFMCGGDQLWNTQLIGYLSKPMFLDYCPEGKKRFSFSTSIGQSDFEDKYKQEIFCYLKKFDALSVREKSAVEAIKQLGISDVKRIFDPALLLPTTYWNEVTTKKLDAAPYALLIPIADNSFVDKSYYNSAINYVKSRELNLLQVVRYKYPRVNKAVEEVFLPEPFEWLAYIKNASLVITDSFHACVFSIIFHVPFVAFLPRKAQLRIPELLSELGLTERLCEDGMVARSAKGTINWHAVDMRIDSEREKAIRYIEKIKHAIVGDKI